MPNELTENFADSSDSEKNGQFKKMRQPENFRLPHLSTPNAYIIIVPTSVVCSAATFMLLNVFTLNKGSSGSIFKL